MIQNYVITNTIFDLKPIFRSFLDFFRFLKFKTTKTKKRYTI